METVGEEEGDSADSGHGPGLHQPPDARAHAFGRTPCLGAVCGGNASGYDRHPHGAAQETSVGTRPRSLCHTHAWKRGGQALAEYRAPSPPAPGSPLSPHCRVRTISAMGSQPGHHRKGGVPEHHPQMSLSDGQMEALLFIKLNGPSMHRDADTDGRPRGERRGKGAWASQRPSSDGETRRDIRVPVGCAAKRSRQSLFCNASDSLPVLVAPQASLWLHTVSPLRGPMC